MKRQGVKIVTTAIQKEMQKVGYYIELVKPRLTAMALFSGAVGYVAAVPAGLSIPDDSCTPCDCTWICWSRFKYYESGHGT